MTLATGTRLGPYEIVSPLGAGGMGEVYRARDTRLGREVAIKALPDSVSADPDRLRRFEKEARSASALNHPNIVVIYDVGESDSGSYIAMELVEGKTLRELLDQGGLPMKRLLTISSQVADGLSRAHAAGIVHRDLKPENIMIGKPTTGGEPVVKLLDLGIAKLREVAGAERTGNTNLTIAGQMLGTPYYMSPEQWGELPEDGNSDIDGRADIYSLGVVMYEIIAGKRPFTGVTLAELRRQHIMVTPPPLHEIDASVPESFGRAIARSMSKDRGARQATAGELERELLTSLSSEGISPATSLPEISAEVPAGISRGVQTSPHQTAATLVTGINQIEEPSSAAAVIPSQAATMPTVVSEPKQTGEAISPAVPQTSYPIPPSPIAPARKTSPLIFLGVGLAVLLLIAGVGGYAVMHYMSSNPSNTSSSINPTKANEGADLAGGHEVGRYWLQVNTADKSDSVRADEQLKMISGQQFKFHFSPSENGYLYIIGPGDNNAPTTFLTAKPAAEFGVDTNEVKSGQDFSFPADTRKNESWLNLDKDPGTDEFTIIFSNNPLTTPDFLDAEALKVLNAAEQKELDDSIAQFKANVLGTEVIKTGASPFVSVKVPQTAAEGAPVVFKVKIEHK